MSEAEREALDDQQQQQGQQGLNLKGKKKCLNNFMIFFLYHEYFCKKIVKREWKNMLDITILSLLRLKVAFFQKVRFVFQIFKSPK